MPIYRYRCKECKSILEVFESMDGNHEVSVCDKCGRTSRRIWDTPALRTDTSFCMTGVEDKRFSEAGQRGVRIEGRKHWDKLVKEKEYVELSDHELKNMD